MAHEKVHYQINGISYYNEITYVDADTGQVLKKTDARNKTKYIITKTIQNGTTGTGAFRTKHITKECKKQPQQRLFS